jgi:hypothetical protein
MKLRCSLLILSLAVSVVPAPAQTVDPRLTKPMVNTGLFNIRPDGSISGSAVDTAEESGAAIAGVVYLLACGGLGASSPGLPVAASATEVWQLSGRVIDLTEERASVQVSWQRVRQGSEDVTGTARSLTLTLSRGERTTLETIDIPAAGACEARRASLDIVFASRLELSPAMSKQGVVVGGGGGRVYFGSGGGTTTATVAAAGQPAPTMPSADLWLVRTTPGQADQTQHVTAPAVTSIPRTFTFAPVTIQTPAGAMLVTVHGTVEIGFSPEGQRRFYLSASRTVTFSPANRPARDAAPITEGSTKTTVPVPGPDEVLSFEMPPLRIAGAPAVPDRFSVRVKLTDIPMRDVARPR